MSNSPSSAQAPTLAKEIRLRDLPSEARLSRQRRGRAKAGGLSLIVGGIIGEFVILRAVPASSRQARRISDEAPPSL